MGKTKIPVLLVCICILFAWYPVLPARVHVKFILFIFSHEKTSGYKCCLPSSRSTQIIYFWTLFVVYINKVCFLNTQHEMTNELRQQISLLLFIEHIYSFVNRSCIPLACTCTHLVDPPFWVYPHYSYSVADWNVPFIIWFWN